MWFSSQISGVWPVPHSWNSWTSDTGTFARISLNINIHISRTAFLTSWCAYLRFGILQVTFWGLAFQPFLATFSLCEEEETSSVFRSSFQAQDQLRKSSLPLPSVSVHASFLCGQEDCLIACAVPGTLLTFSLNLRKSSVRLVGGIMTHSFLN